MPWSKGPWFYPPPPLFFYNSTVVPAYADGSSVLPSGTGIELVMNYNSV
jgi:hypothetical protein